MWTNGAVEFETDLRFWTSVCLPFSRQAALYDRAHAMLMMARVMFTDLVVVKKLDEREIDETDFMKRVMDKLRTRIREGLRALEDSSSSEEDGRWGWEILDVHIA